ncbi:hypothetical protein CVT26_011329 [Gymnopilus dilepis]|uniref:Uncharacterized protein n=1 Tax=Gymnopilus dilepis TaxID=231916 RepID=A0A409X4I4_9AGAR|nr:hypothetical protein CVT26_011329 [Gymnopilus dilepis]
MGKERDGAPQDDHSQSAAQAEDQQRPQFKHQRSPTFWYVEEIYMAVPSSWTVEEPEEDLRQALEEALAKRAETSSGGGKGLHEAEIGGLEEERGGEVMIVMERIEESHVQRCWT